MRLSKRQIFLLAVLVVLAAVFLGILRKQAMDIADARYEGGMADAF